MMGVTQPSSEVMGLWFILFPAALLVACVSPVPHTIASWVLSEPVM